MTFSKFFLALFVINTFLCVSALFYIHARSKSDEKLQAQYAFAKQSLQANPNVRPALINDVDKKRAQYNASFRETLRYEGVVLMIFSLNILCGGLYGYCALREGKKDKTKSGQDTKSNTRNIGGFTARDSTLNILLLILTTIVAFISFKLLGL